MNAVVKLEPQAGSIVEQVIIKGDLSKLTPDERTRYYVEVCKSVGLNPLTKPFEYITLNGKLTLYALRACTDQLRSVHGVSVSDMTETERDGVFIVTAKVSNKEGRTDIAKGAVSIANLKGEALANALMKAETKAKRRATLSICGLGWLDESEVDSIPGAVKGEPPAPTPAVIAPVVVETPHDPETGELNAPHSIAVPQKEGKPAWITWGALIIAAYKAAKDADELSGWLEANSENLETCEAEAPKAYKSILGAYQKRAKEVAPAPVAPVDQPSDADDIPEFLKR